ncbi:AraC family transcriptional regulator [Thalassobacterium sedimentorum]
MTSKRCTWIINDSTELDLTGGSIAIIPPNTVIQGRHGFDEPNSHYWFDLNFEAEKATQHTSFDKNFLENAAHTFQEVQLQNIQMQSEFIQLMDTFKRVHFSATKIDLICLIELRSLFCLILVKLLQQIRQEPASESSKYIFQKVINYFYEHFDQSIQLQDLTRVTNVSSQTLNRICKKETGCTPADYLLKLRLAKSKELLKLTSKSILDIGLDCGFSSSQYFARRFKQQYGLSPRAYRKHSD